MPRARIAASASAAALILATGITACRSAAQTAAVAQRPSTVVRDVVTTGTVEPLSTVQVGAQITGTIDKLFVDFNSLVRKGQVMAHIESSIYEANLESAKGSLGDAQGQLQYAVATANDAHVKLTQAEALRANQTITAQDLEDAKVAADQADAQVKSAQSLVTVAQASVDQANVDLEHTLITAPIDGVVVSRNVDKGQTVSASVATPILFLVTPDLRQMQVEATVDESDVAHVHDGDKAEFTVDAYPSSTFEGHVVTVRLVAPAPPPSTASASAPAPAVGTTTAATTASTVTSGTVVNYDAIIAVSNPDEKLRPGMTAIVTFPAQRPGPLTPDPR